MPSDDEKKIVEFPKEKKNNGPEGDKKVKTAKVKKPHKSIGWFFGIVILILISITFILPTTIFTPSSSDIVFGKYDGKKISLELDSFFYYQLQTIANYYAQQYGGSVPTAAWAQIYYQAFQSAIIYEAVSGMAEDAKIIPSHEAVAKAVIDSGYWNNAAGEFDTERYQSATSTERSAVQTQIEMSLPYTMVMTDIQGAKISQAETDFIASMSNYGARSFDYMVVGPEAYGDAETVAYANNNPAPFVQIGLSAVTYATETEATDVLNALNAGTMTFEDAVKDSIDGYKVNDGSMGLVYKNTLDLILSLTGIEGAADSVYSTAVGSYAGPYYTSAGYTVFRVDSAPAMPDLEDEAVLVDIKNHIASTDNAIIATYLGGVANDAYNLALEDVDKALAEFNLPYYSVDDVALNPGNSGLIYSIGDGDTEGFLKAAVDAYPEYLETLFTSEIGTVLPPQVSGTSYVITIPAEAEGSSYAESMKGLVPRIYPSYAGQFALIDVQNSILNSDKVENNFFDTFYSKIMSTNSANV